MSGKNIRRLAALIVLAALLAHARSITYGFVFDEQILIVDNPAVHSLANAGKILTQKFWPGQSRGIYYRPVVTLSYALDWALAGESPRIYHLTNLIAHAAASLLAFFLLIRLTGNEKISAIAAFVFAVHPVHVESVAWIPGRTDVFAAALMMASWIMLLRARDDGGRVGKVLANAAAAFLYLAALGSKEIAVLLPPLLILHDLLTRGREARSAWGQYLVITLVTAAFLIFRGHVLSGAGPAPAPDALANVSAAESARAILAIFAKAFRETILPGPWRIDFAHANSILAAPAWAAAAGAIVIAGLLAVSVIFRKKNPLVSFAALGFPGSLVPVSQLAPFPTLFAERFLYLPSLFISLLIACVVIEIIGRDDKERKDRPKRGPARVVLLLLVIVGLAAVSSLRSRPFKNDLTFWRTAVSQAPGSALAHNWLGVALRNRGEFDRAGEEYKKALELDPDFTAALINLAEIRVRRGDLRGGIETLEQAARRDPASTIIKNNLGVCYAKDERWNQAEEQWRQSLALDPDNLNAHLFLANYFLAIKKEPAKARPHIEAANKISPDDPRLSGLEKQLGR